MVFTPRELIGVVDWQEILCQADTDGDLESFTFAIADAGSKQFTE